jgi:hydrogenase maturation protein HypF
LSTRQIILSGQVQGVGFRPFVYRLARQLDIKGNVRNSSGQVIILAQAQPEQLQQFEQLLIEQAPPLAKPKLQCSESISHDGLENFVILPSQAATAADIHIPPDYFMCDDCLAEMSDPQQRRYRYPFTNCTQCGPRYSIIKALPYDRPNTSMADFTLCADCQAEYNNPADRRFHAQPLACPACGPVLSWRHDNEHFEGNEAALQACLNALAAGRIVAVKGIGGYHLMCDAGNDAAVALLRQRKPRPDKPLAVMFPMRGDDGLELVRQHCDMSLTEQQLLLTPQRPIVLLQQKTASLGTALSSQITPGLQQIGAFLPYSPLHHLLLEDYGKPLVATSANISGEPVLTDADAVEHRLSKVADAFLHHNRPIVRPADDPVIQVLDQQVLPLRLGRGLAPLELSLPFKLEQPVLAVGGHQKVTVALAWQSRVVISPHISDLGSLRTDQVFRQVIEDLQQLYQVKAQHIVCDAHPSYASHQWAQQQDMPVHTAWHHHAHASSVSGEYPQHKNWLCFCWDGTGLGSDGSIWGGETFFGQPGNWQRVASMQPLHLPGGDKASREPWRAAVAWRWSLQHDWLPDIEHAELAHQAWQKRLNCPASSAVGRLFDAAASMVLNINHCSFEGQAAMQLEAIADDSDDFIQLPLQEDGVLRVDWSVLTDVFLDQQLSASRRAAMFHNSLAASLIEQALLLRQQYDFEAIGLSGGVFQNRRLCQRILQLAQQQGLRVLLPSQVPVNDGGLSYGQIIEFAASRNK